MIEGVRFWAMAEAKKDGFIQRLLRFVREEIWGVLPAEFGFWTLKPSAILWGGALIGYAAYKAWDRARHSLPVGTAPYAIAVIGVLVSAALLTPKLDQAFFRFVMRVMTIVGFFVSSALMTFTFYVFVTPLGWLLKALGKDPLGIRADAGPMWHPHRHDTTRRRYYRMF